MLVDVPRPSPGSLWIPGALFGDPARDLRASQPGDLVTVVVVERASAVAKGTTKASRSSSVKNSIGAFAGKTRATGPLAHLADLSGDSQLAGEGATTRETVLSTTLAGRVTHVLPNGNLVVEANKEVQVNAERQYVTVRGVARPLDMIRAMRSVPTGLRCWRSVFRAKVLSETPCAVPSSYTDYCLGCCLYDAGVQVLSLSIGCVSCVSGHRHASQRCGFD